jgi:hypothetical protein
MQSPLLGFNNNVKHRGRLFHIQTEDSGVRHPHVITHLFMDGGRILKTVKTSYVQHVGSDRLSEVVRDLMKEQHKMMFIALRDGQFDYVLDPDDAPPVSRAGGNSTSRATFQPTPTPPAGDGGPGLAKGATSQVGAKPSAAVRTPRDRHIVQTAQPSARRIPRERRCAPADPRQPSSPKRDARQARVW